MVRSTWPKILKLGAFTPSAISAYFLAQQEITYKVVWVVRKDLLTSFAPATRLTSDSRLSCSESNKDTFCFSSYNFCLGTSNDGRRVTRRLITGRQILQAPPQRKTILEMASALSEKSFPARYAPTSIAPRPAFETFSHLISTTLSCDVASTVIKGELRNLAFWTKRF